MRSLLVPKINAGRVRVSVKATKLASGEIFPASGLYSMPIEKRGVT